MRVLVVDDHAVVRRGVRSLLCDQAGWDVCGEAVDGQDAIEEWRRHLRSKVPGTRMRNDGTKSLDAYGSIAWVWFANCASAFGSG
jgi:DNA-binding NarL/FixJ family response regulator